MGRKGNNRLPSGTPYKQSPSLWNTIQTMAFPLEHHTNNRLPSGTPYKHTNAPSVKNVEWLLSGVWWPTSAEME